MGRGSSSKCSDKGRNEETFVAKRQGKTHRADGHFQVGGTGIHFESKRAKLDDCRAFLRLEASSNSEHNKNKLGQRT
jgi:hypothetical protein